MPKKPDAPVLLVRWYDYTEWLLERVDSFPKNQRFIFAARLADAVLGSVGAISYYLRVDSILQGGFVIRSIKFKFYEKH
jgi:hypothetical protein